MKKAIFITKPNFVYEFTGEDGLKSYSMSSDLVFWTGKKQIVIKAVDHNETFITNLASVPKFLHSILKPDSKYLKYARALHDGMYEAKNLFTRVYSDWTYLKALKADDCPFALRWSCFLGVRMFGSSYR